MRVIYKYQIGNFRQVLLIPSKGIVRHFAMKDGVPTCWIEIETTDEVTTNRCFYIVGTGHPINEKDTYFGTCQDGSLVWHLFEQQEIQFKRPELPSDRYVKG